MTEYVTVKVPKVLLQRFHALVGKEYGYRNFSEFVVEAIRERLKEFDFLD
jgi:metal-responsive CopG/Arc/MetJ family transcriptional regulator